MSIGGEMVKRMILAQTSDKEMASRLHLPVNDGKNQMKAEIRKTYEVSNTHEISVDWNGYNFLVIYGKHKGGWFIAIPDWEVCVEASDPTDNFYNSEKLAKALNKANAGVELAKAIKEHWEGLEK